MFFSMAYAQSTGASAGSLGDPLGMIVPALMVLGVFWFFMIRPQQKKAQEHRETLKNIRRGDTIVVSGMIGKVHRLVDDTEVVVEFSENVRIRVVKAMISDVRSKGEPLKESAD